MHLGRPNVRARKACIHRIQWGKGFEILLANSCACCWRSSFTSPFPDKTNFMNSKLKFTSFRGASCFARHTNATFHFASVIAGLRKTIVNLYTFGIQAAAEIILIAQPKIAMDSYTIYALECGMIHISHTNYNLRSMAPTLNFNCAIKIITINERHGHALWSTEWAKSVAWNCWNRQTKPKRRSEESKKRKGSFRFRHNYYSLTYK